MPKFSRKDKIVMEEIVNPENITTIVISIEGNHMNNKIDFLMNSFNNDIKNLMPNYKEKVKEKPTPKPKAKAKGKKEFGTAGGMYV